MYIGVNRTKMKEPAIESKTVFDQGTMAGGDKARERLRKGQSLDVMSIPLKQDMWFVGIRLAKSVTNGVLIDYRGG